MSFTGERSYSNGMSYTSNENVQQDEETKYIKNEQWAGSSSQQQSLETVPFKA